MSEEWGPWIEHDGRGCPCVGMWVEYEAGDPYSRKIRLRGHIKRVSGRKGWIKSDYGKGPNGKTQLVVLRYRIRKPKGLTILEGLLEDLPEKVDA